MGGILLRSCCSLSIILIAGCTNIPELREDGIAISEIVERIKCEMAFALPPPEGSYPTGSYQWLRYWTAKIDLTLVTNELSSLNPSISVTEPARMFNLTAGGGVTTTAIRNETLSFTLSVDELIHSRSLDCARPLQEGLLGHLGLAEWISSSLAPTENHQLTIGYHAPPTGKPAPIPGPTGQQPAALLSQEVQLANRALSAAEELAQNARTYAARAKRYALMRNVQGTYDAASRAYGYAETAIEQADKAQAWVWKATIKDRGGAELSPEDTKLLAKIKDGIKATTEEANGATKTAKAAWELLPRDPPIDSIAHQAQFIVALTGNITPNWTLVKFKGPGANSTFAAGAHTTTNTLNIVLGQPAEPGGKAMSDEQKRQLFFQRLDTLRSFVVPVPLL